MINRQSVISIYALAGVAEREGTVIMPFADTPLAALNSAIGPFNTAPELVEESLVGASESTNQLGEAEHSDALDEMVSIAADAVRKQLKFARELVRPVASDVFERVTTYLDNVAPEALRHSIEVVDLPAIYNESSLEDMVSRYKAQPQIDLPMSQQFFPELSAEELIGRCKTGMSRFDAELKKVIEGSETLVTRVYDVYFRGKPDFDAAQGSYEVEKIVAFVLARSLSASVPDGVNVDLATWRSTTAVFTAEFGRRLYQTLRRRDRISRQNQIIEWMPTPTNPSPIRVHGEVYRRFIKEGGVPEAIIGACLRGIDMPGYKDLLEDAYGGCKAVKSNEKILQARLVTEYEANVTLAIADSIDMVIKAGELPEGVDLPSMQDVKAWLRECPFRKKDNLDDYVLRCVCQAVFPRYQAYPVLAGIMNYMAHDESLTNREAATLVTIDLVGEWLAAQLTTENVGK